ncbi:MAG: polysaccharide biosynthesis tyrosine autokinase [Candidatus Hodarchaeota archaeon]
MGKISNALERYKKEKSIKAGRLATANLEYLNDKEPGSSLAREFVIQNGFRPKLVALSAPESLDAENFKTLRSQILFPRDGERPKTIMVTSTFPREGKTFVAANLAVSLALGINEYVLLVDCDFRNPNLHEMLGYSNLEGLHEYLTGGRKLADLLIRTKIEKLSLLTAGSIPSNPTELVSSTMMKDFLEEVKGRYRDRFIIIDATPSQVTAEANVLAKYVDGIIFVVMAQKTPRETIQSAIENLGKKKILGVVFNGYSKAEKSYHKYYGKSYKKKT